MPSIVITDGMRRVIEGVEPGQELRYLDYQGHALPW